MQLAGLPASLGANGFCAGQSGLKYWPGLGAFFEFVGAGVNFDFVADFDEGRNG